MRTAAVVILLLAMSVFSAEDQNVVKIFTYAEKATRGYCATAFFVSPTKLVTAAHTFSNKTTNHWIKIGPETVPVTILRIDFERDICLVETIKYVNPTWYTLQRNGVVRLKGFRKEERDLSEEPLEPMRDRISTRNIIIDGESGGPLVNESGQVVGMGIQNKGKTCISVSSDTICKFLDEVAPEFKTVPAQAKN